MSYRVYAGRLLIRYNGFYLDAAGPLAGHSVQKQESNPTKEKLK